jgi:two-component system, cell cycle response regulator DivK
LNRILMIEDNTVMRKMLETNLTARGYRVILAENGQQGLAISRCEGLDLVLLDIQLPGMSGWDVLKAFKADDILKSIPVVIMTASLANDDSDLAMRLGTAAYFPKPFALHDFINFIGKTLQTH